MQKIHSLLKFGTVLKNTYLLLEILVLTPFLVYLIWGVFRIGFEGGPYIQLGPLGMTVSDAVAWLICILIPIGLITAFIWISHGLNWKKRVLLPLILGPLIIFANICTGVALLLHEYRSGDNVFNDCTTTIYNGEPMQECPAASH